MRQGLTHLLYVLTTSLVIALAGASAFGQCTVGTVWNGEGTYDELGGKVAGGSDINGDGVPDFMIAAPKWNPDHYYGSTYGRVYLYSGADYSLLHTIESPTGGSLCRVGQAIDTLGDVNGDGYADFLVGARTWIDTDTTYSDGVVFVFSGQDYSIIHALQDTLSPNMARMVECIGDITKDGVNDFMAGGLATSGYPARITVYDGASGAVLTTYSDPDGNMFWTGETGAGVGDLDGDTYPDFVIGASHWSANWPPTAEGRIDVYSGQTFELLWSAEGDTAETYLGTDVSGVGDVNGDGVNDVLCGTYVGVIPGADNVNGYVVLYSGSDGSVIYKRYAPLSKCREFGTPVAGLGDLNHDGYADYGIGDATYNVGNGSSWAFSGKDGAILGLALNGGSSIATAGDVDANGTLDILVGNIKGSTNGLKSGTVLLRTCIWPDSACSDGADTDGDGWDDDCDNCPYQYDTYQYDSDDDGVGDVCTRKDTVITGADVYIGEDYGNVTFDSVTAAGSVTFEEMNTAASTDGAYMAIPNGTPRFYNIETTAGYSGSIQVCLRYDPAGLTAAQEDSIQLFHYTGTVWDNITTSIDTSINVVCGVTTTLSPFGMGLPVFVSVGDSRDHRLPQDFMLEQSYPNPCNPSTTIEFTLPEAARVRLTIYDVLGRTVVKLLDAPMPAGSNRVIWRGRAASGQVVSSGTYFYRLETPERVETRKLLLLK